MMQRQDANDEENGRRVNGINIECNVGGERVSQWAATDVRSVRGQIQGTLRAPLGQVGRIQGTLRGAITKGSGTLGKGPGGPGGGRDIWDLCVGKSNSRFGNAARCISLRSDILCEDRLSLKCKSKQWI